MEGGEQRTQGAIPHEAKSPNEDTLALGEPRLSDEEKEAMLRRSNAIEETVRTCVRQILPVLKHASNLGYNQWNMCYNCAFPLSTLTSTCIRAGVPMDELLMSLAQKLAWHGVSMKYAFDAGFCSNETCGEKREFWARFRWKAAN